MQRKLSIVIVMMLSAVLALAQSVVNNDAVIKMSKAGLSEDIILATVNGQPGSYTTGADALIALKSAGVTDKVISAMIAKGSGGGAAAPVTVAAAPMAASPVNEIGVYYSKAGVWTDLAPEVVNFKTGGVLKSIGTAGIVKGDVNGHLNGEHSPNGLKSPVDILVYTPEGTNVSEYQLLRLHDAKDSREFRTVTGGVLHVSGGATRDIIPFDSKKIAARTYQVVVPNLGPGEYGLLPPAGSDATSSSGRIGKIYSFRIIE